MAVRLQHGGVVTNNGKSEAATVLHLPPVVGDLATFLGDDRTLRPKCMLVSVIFVVRSHVLRVIISPVISSAIVAT